MESTQQYEMKKTWAVWFTGCCFAFMFFVLPFSMITPIKTSEGKWKFVERTPEGDQGWLAVLIILFFIASLIYFVIGVIRTKFVFERIEHEELGLYELCYALSWTIFLMGLMICIIAPSSNEVNNFQLEFVLLLVPLLLFRKNLSLIGFRRQSISLKVIGAILLCYGAAYLADKGMEWLMNALSIDMYSAREELIASTLKGYFQKGQWLSLIGEMAFISLVGPIWEEVLFRGLLQTYFARKWGTYFAVVASSLLFAMSHGDPSYMPTLFVSGLILGGLYAYTKSLWPGIILHVLNNTVCTILIVFFPHL